MHPSSPVLGQADPEPSRRAWEHRRHPAVARVARVLCGPLRSPWSAAQYRSRYDRRPPSDRRGRLPMHEARRTARARDRRSIRRCGAAPAPCCGSGQLAAQRPACAGYAGPGASCSEGSGAWAPSLQVVVSFCMFRVWRPLRLSNGYYVP